MGRNRRQRSVSRQREKQIERADHRRNGKRKRPELEAKPQMGIPCAIIFCGGYAVDRCDQVQAQKYRFAPNVVKVAVQKRTGYVMSITVVPHGDDSRRKSTGSGQSLTYEEHPAETPLTVLKIADDSTGGYRKWDEVDGFNPRRFNPDAIPHTAREMTDFINRR